MDELSPDRFRVERAAPRGFAQAYVRVLAKGGGGGVPLLLLHGWPETLRIWWRNLEPLAEAGFDVIAPDLRGFGQSELAPDGRACVASHSRDLYALLRDELGLASVVAAAGDLGGAVLQDLSLRYPGFVERAVLFNAPLPYLKERMQGLRSRQPRETLDYYLRQGRDADALAAELDTPERRRRYIADFYTSRDWAHPGAFEPAAVDFMTEPFADAAKLRAGFANYEAALDPAARSERPLLRENPTRTLILFGTSDRVMPPDFDRMAAAVFPDRVGPFRVRDAGHFLQWEAAELLNGAIASFCGDLLFARAERGAGALHTAYVSIGSNLGERENHLARALQGLRATPGVLVRRVSRVYETDPVGPPPQSDYLNAAAELETRLEPRALLARLHELETEAGRQRGSERNAARTLDLDILCYADLKIDEPELSVPHPRMHERAFVLEPLCDIAPGLVHPVLSQRIDALAERVRDPAAVRMRP